MKQRQSGLGPIMLKELLFRSKVFGMCLYPFKEVKRHKAQSGRAGDMGHGESFSQGKYVRVFL